MDKSSHEKKILPKMMEDLVDQGRRGGRVEEAQGYLVAAGHREKRVAVDAVDGCGRILVKVVLFPFWNIVIDKSFQKDLLIEERFDRT